MTEGFRTLLFARDAVVAASAIVPSSRLSHKRIQQGKGKEDDAGSSRAAGADSANVGSLQASATQTYRQRAGSDLYEHSTNINNVHLFEQPAFCTHTSALPPVALTGCGRKSVPL